MNNPPILLLGYNRHDLLEKRVNEVSKMEVEKIYISIDGGIESHKPEMNDLILKIPNLFSSYVKVEITHHEKNLGLTKHFTSAITKILEENENIIVVEDDIVLNSNFYKNITNGINLLEKIGANGLVSAFSPVNYSGNYFLRNRWRKSIYFACWGWGCSRETWRKYNPDLSSLDINNTLRNSRSWNSLSDWQKNIWRSRFKRVQLDISYTWDIQMQFASFLNDFTNIAPLYKFASNEGFNDKRATHTKESKPRWVGNNSKNKQLINYISGKPLGNLMQKIDQLTVAGDSKYLAIYKKMNNHLNQSTI